MLDAMIRIIVSVNSQISSRKPFQDVRLNMHTMLGLINGHIVLISAKSRRFLPDFKPQWDARKGAQELYEVYRECDLKLDEFEGPKYKRIDHIKLLLNDGMLDSSLRWTKTEAKI